MTSQKNLQPDLTLVIDQGSHASRIALFDETGELIYLKSKDVSTQSYSVTDGQTHYEQDADEIVHSIRNLLNALPIHLQHKIKNCGLCTQRSTIVAWHKTCGTALSPAISWRDTRAQSQVESLRDHENQIKAISGLPLSAHYSASKIHWLLNNNSNIQQAEASQQLHISPLASYLLFHLLNEQPYLIDHSNAQRCQLFDIKQLNWSDVLLNHFQINSQILPVCTPTCHHYGHLYLNDAPLTALTGDQNAALYAFPELHKKHALINIGTGAFILSPSSRNNHPSKLLHTLASSTADNCQFVNEGTVNGAGAAISWQRQIDVHNHLENNIFDQLPLWLKQINSPGIFINTISGLGSPWWCNTAGPAQYLNANLNMSSNSSPTPPHLQAQHYVAIIESIVFLIYKNIQQLNTPPNHLFISGGLSQLSELCQKLADCSQIKVLRFSTRETTARGCAWLSNQSCKNNHLNWKALQTSEQFLPQKNYNKNLEIQNRYQQFVGELNKRCTSD